MIHTSMTSVSKECYENKMGAVGWRVTKGGEDKREVKRGLCEHMDR